jgi:hypothetical protein
MSHPARWIVACLAALATGPWPAAATDLPAGVRDHEAAVDGGSVNWTRGHLRAEGRGVAAGRGPEDQLLARRAALEDAKRNAIALVAGVRIDADRTVRDVEDGLLRVEGRIRGFREVEESWHPERDPPEQRIVIEVPLWGVQGIAEVLLMDRRTATRRRELHPGGEGGPEALILVDGRGLGVEPGLFPSIVEADGTVLYDVDTLSAGLAGAVPVVRYVESDLPYESLSAAFHGALVPEVLPAAYALPPQEDPKEKPDEDGGEGSKRRQKRLRTVKAVQGVGEAKTTLVLTAEDARKLADSPDGARALRNGKVIVVVDAAAAGSEGRLRPLPTRPGDGVGHRLVARPGRRGEGSRSAR